MYLGNRPPQLSFRETHLPQDSAGSNALRGAERRNGVFVLKPRLERVNSVKALFVLDT
jgi:hypothetical protein